MNGDGIMRATTRRLAAPALALLVTFAGAAAPAHAAPAAAAAGITWSNVMQRKLALETEAGRLSVLLPTMRSTVAAHNADITAARTAQAAAAATVATAATADRNARAAQTRAGTVVTAARKALADAQKRRPRKATRIAAAKKALAAAEATVRTRTATVRRTAAALTAARAGYATATGRVTAATSAHQSATLAVATAEQKIRSLPQTRAALAAQASALSGQVVTQTRATFTVAQTTQVYGVTVNRIVAHPFQRMIDDAARAGIQLSGGGFRTKQRQVELRKINGCPDLWTAPASSCRVPTAIPGRSLHEIGLAIDITSGGRTITDRKGAPFRWLAANAGRYGLVNLPSEPWHWSITGG